jgi:hypothetical protein
MLRGLEIMSMDRERRGSRNGTFALCLAVGLGLAAQIAVAFPQDPGQEGVPESRQLECRDAQVECAIQDALAIVPRLRYEHPFVGGTMFITSGGTPGTATDIDLRGDLGLDAGDEPLAGLDIAFGNHRFRLSYESLSFTGRSTLDDAVTFHGMTFPAGTNIKGTLDLTFFSAGYDYRIVHSPCWDLRVGGAAFLWNFDAKVADTGSGIGTSRAFTHALPELTCDSEIGLGRSWYLSARAAGGLLATDRFMVDVEASIGVTIWKRANLELGYRAWKLQFHETTNEASIWAHGPFLQLSFRF